MTNDATYEEQENRTSAEQHAPVRSLVTFAWTAGSVAQGTRRVVFTNPACRGEFAPAGPHWRLSSPLHSRLVKSCRRGAMSAETAIEVRGTTTINLSVEIEAKVESHALRR